MGVIRPTYNNWSAGEITPELAGRTDHPLYQAGASQLKNMAPSRLGGVSRRGALVRIAEAYNGRLIPWSVNATYDFMLLLSADGVRIINVSTGMDLGFISSPQLPVTTIGSSHPIYSINDVWAVKYAQNNNSIYLAHADYPLFEIKFERYDSVNDEYFFTMGTVVIEGNIATSKKIDETIGITDPIVTSYLMSALEPLRVVDNNNNPIIYPATGWINNKEVQSVQKLVTTTARHLKWGHDRGGAPGSRAGDMYDSSTQIGTIFELDIAWVAAGNADFRIARSHRGTELVRAHRTSTATQLLDKCESALGSDSTYYVLWFDYIGLFFTEGTDLVGQASYRRANSKTTYRIRFVDNSTLDISSDTTSLTGYLMITNLNISINKTAVPGNEIVERLSPWMEAGIPYPCDGSMLFNGARPITAIKDTSGDEPAIIVNIEGQGQGVRITRDSSGFTGQLGVIVTPFYTAGDNPGLVAFHQGRMVIGGSRINPNTIFLSKTNEPNNFMYFEEVEYEKTSIKPKPWADDDVPEFNVSFDTVQQIGASSAIMIKLATDEDEAIKWATSVSDLIIGTSTSEWVIPADITAINPRAVLTTRNGSSDIQGRFVKGSVMFIPRSRRGAKMFEPKVGEVTGYATEHAKHLFSGQGRVKSFDFRQDPEHQIVMVLDSGDGVLGTISDNVIGWAHIFTRDSDSIVSMVAINGDGEDYIFAIVKRLTNAGYKYFFEQLVTMDDGSPSGRVYLDHRQYIGNITLGIAGLDDYIGQSPKVLFTSGQYGTLVIGLDGISTQYIPDGEINPIPLYTGVGAYVGYEYDSIISTVRLDSPELEGTRKQGGPMHVRVHKSGPFKFKKHIYGDEIDIEIPTTDDGQIIYPYTGAIRFEGLSPSSVDHYATLVSKGAHPLNVQLISTTYNVAEIV
jgi:hypothetical protein